MASIWWVVVAFFAGGMGGALLVALLNINAGHDDELRMGPLDSNDQTGLGLSS